VEPTHIRLLTRQTAADRARNGEYDRQARPWIADDALAASRWL